MGQTDQQATAASGADCTANPAPVLMLPSLPLLRFRRLMQAEGRVVDLQRMCLDTTYAHHCLASAHTSSDARLRQAALALFDTYGRNTTPPALH